MISSLFVLNFISIIALYFLTWFVTSFFLYYKICFFLINKIGFLNSFYIIFSISFIVVSYIIRSNLINCYKSFWINLILITNVFGCFLYLCFGKKNLSYKQKIFRCNTKKILASFNNVNQNVFFENKNLISKLIFDKTGSKLCRYKIKYSYNFKEVKQIILDKIKMAKKFVFIEFFIIENSFFLDSIINILQKKVKEGVEVRLIYDGLGSLNRVPFWYDKKLNKLGIKTLVFGRMSLFNFYNFNCRNHRKMIIVDDEICFSGSFNISDHCKDSFLMLEGENVHNLTTLFLVQWLNISNIDLKNLLKKNNVENYIKFLPNNNYKNDESDDLVQVYSDFPYNRDHTNTTFYVYLNLVINAKKCIYIVTPYFIIDKKLKKELLNALKRKVELVIIVPNHSDVNIVDYASYGTLNELLSNGAKIFKHFKTINDNYFLHSKFCIVDEKFALIGTSNFNFRSFFYDYENSFFMFKSDCIKNMKEHFLLLLSESKKDEIKNFSFMFNFLLRVITIFC